MPSVIHRFSQIKVNMLNDIINVFLILICVVELEIQVIRLDVI